jgi:hypothetical protein
MPSYYICGQSWTGLASSFTLVVVFVSSKNGGVYSMANSMAWMAGWFPLLSFLCGTVAYYYIPKKGAAFVLTTLLTLGLPLLAMLLWFTMNYWPWLLFFVFIGWFGNWAGNMVIQWQKAKRS